MKAIKLYVRLVDRLSTLIGLAMSLLIPAMMLVITYEVVLRYFLRSPTVWAFDTAIFMFGYVGLLSGAYALKHGLHINVDILHARFSARRRAVIDSITAPLVCFFLVLVIVYGWRSGWDAWSHGARRPSEWGPPLGHFMLMIPLGALLLLLQAVANWLRSLHRAITDRELEV